MPLYPAKNIDEVLMYLDQIIDECHANRSRLGLFAALYRRTTQEVKDAMDAGQFQNPERMDRLDAIFANRYLQAYFDWKNGLPVSDSWDLSFKASKNPSHWIYQHILLGMNAHINLDLGIATAETADFDNLETVKEDFDEINRILERMVDGVQDALAEIVPWVGWLDWIGGRKDEKLISKMIEKARWNAWGLAESVVQAPEEGREAEISKADGLTCRSSRRILSTGGIVNKIMWIFWVPEQFMLRRAISSLRK